MSLINEKLHEIAIQEMGIRMIYAPNNDDPKMKDFLADTLSEAYSKLDTMNQELNTLRGLK